LVKLSVLEAGCRLIGTIGTITIPITHAHTPSITFISIAIQRGNAASVMGTVYNDRILEEIYNL
jgi:hypothetical protein